MQTIKAFPATEGKYDYQRFNYKKILHFPLKTGKHQNLNISHGAKLSTSFKWIKCV